MYQGGGQICQPLRNLLISLKPILKFVDFLCMSIKVNNKLELELCQAQAWLIVGLRFTLFLLEIQNKKQDEV